MRHRPVAAQLDTEQILQALEHLAEAVWARGAQPVHYSDLFELIKGIASKVGVGLDPQRVDLELRTAAFLIRSSEGYYRFSHRSFLEFFFARHLLRLVEEEDPSEGITALSHQALRVEVVRFFDDLWRANGHESPCGFAVPLLSSETTSLPVRENLFHLGWWLADERAKREVGPESSPDSSNDLLTKRSAIAAHTLPTQNLCLAGVDLSGEDLRGIVIDKGDLSRARLVNTNFTRAGPVTLYPDETYVGEGKALEWLEYQEAEENPSSPLPILYRATDLPHLQRSVP